VGQNYFKIKRGTNLEPTAVAANSAGDLQAASSLDNQLVYHDGSATAIVATETNEITLTNKTIVDAYSLSVTGDTVLQAVTANGNVLINGSVTSGNFASTGTVISQSGLSEFASARVNGAATVTGNLSVGGNASITGTLSATGAASLQSTLSVGSDASITGTLSVTGNSTFQNAMNIGGNASVTGTLSVTGNSTLQGALTVNNDASVTGNISVGGNASVTGALSATGNASLQGTLSVTGVASFDSEFNLKHLSATPSNPAAGRNKVYYKNDGKLYQLTSAGSESLLGAGAYVPSGTRASPANITAVGGITFGGQQRELAFIQGSGGHINVTANPQISAGTSVGQELTLIGRNDSQTVTLENGDGLELNGEAVLGASDSLSLVWDGTSWVEISRN
jgi:predicted acyltransferase (DUF342 family)